MSLVLQFSRSCQTTLPSIHLHQSRRWNLHGQFISFQRSGCSQRLHSTLSKLNGCIGRPGFSSSNGFRTGTNTKYLHHRLSSPFSCLYRQQNNIFSLQRSFTSLLHLNKNEVKHLFYTQFASFHKKNKKTKTLMRDILVYSHDNEKFYKMFAYFGVFQMLIWLYLAEMFQHFKTAPKGTVDTTDMPWWKWVIYKEGQFKNSLSALSVAVGLIVVYISVTYPRRAIREMWLLSGGQNVRMETYSLFKSQKTVVAPVESLDCQGSRTGVGGFIPIKVKGNKFFFMVDKRGEFHERDLFDFKIGLKRDIR